MIRFRMYFPRTEYVKDAMRRQILSEALRTVRSHHPMARQNCYWGLRAAALLCAQQAEEMAQRDMVGHLLTVSAVLHDITLVSGGRRQ